MVDALKCLLCACVVCCVGVTEALLQHRRLSPYNPRLLNPLRDGFSYRTLNFTQNVDHFGFRNTDQFQQRYLVADQFWNHDNGPIFFYTGNEGDIAWICNNTGFLWDIAPEFKALLVFAEHRYYGQSLPYGSESYANTSVLDYLTSEQALADYAELIRHIKQTTPGTANSPVIVFGGSYGGMLAAWMRLKYPSLVLGALASSAPVWQFEGLTPCGGFYSQIQQIYESVSPQCVDNMATTWLAVMGCWPNDLDFLTKTFSLCKPLEIKLDLGTLMDWITTVLVNMATVNYPYPASFMEPLPAWPVQEFCRDLKTPLTGKPLLEAVAKGMKMYFNCTGQAACLNMTKHATDYFGDRGWHYQTCTELVMPMCSNNTKMFYDIPLHWDMYVYSFFCHAALGVSPRENWISLQYWGKEIKSASNIIFSNGLLDPLAQGGVLETLSPSLIAIQIPMAAQQLDLRGENPADPPDVRAAREQEKNILTNWLYGWNQE
ncbi:hypothetical protein BaRGS_00004842 [Batillaria attramentaria]|uniref:Lysosomal Pro-X carboxypeptidase n=1 Tax=Batillaria attramentaria TaxID=370345 RepID=A0ABD0LVP8_9CAEN